MSYLNRYFKNNGILITSKYAKIVKTFSVSQNYKLKSIVDLSIHLLQWLQCKKPHQSNSGKDEEVLGLAHMTSQTKNGSCFTKWLEVF